MNKFYDGTVLNLYTGEYSYYSKEIHPSEAVIAAYAQSKGDWNTWLYEKYEDLLRESEDCVFCGDFSTFKRKNDEVLH